MRHAEVITEESFPLSDVTIQVATALLAEIIVTVGEEGVGA